MRIAYFIEFHSRAKELPVQSNVICLSCVSRFKEKDFPWQFL